ncbi:MAG: GNAT family N-acetyltransferase [Thermotogae bacterium]|nr:GNAT family N-acetyltransferase [Thermotogota bacterium]
MYVLHIVNDKEWNDQSTEKEYITESFKKDGFIHCSDYNQIVRVAESNFAEKEKLTVLVIDTEKLKSKLVYEDLYMLYEKYPHIYGKINKDSVSEIFVMEKDSEGKFFISDEIITLCTKSEIKLKNGKKLVMRSALVSDAEDMIDYFNHVAGETDNLTFGNGEFELSLEDERNKIKQSNNSTAKIIYNGFTDGKLVANLTFTKPRRKRLSHKGEFGITVRKDYWNIGVARAMLNNLIENAKFTGNISKINLKVREDNLRAIKLYEKLGFQREGTERRSFYINGKFYDSEYMGLEI